MSSDRFYVNPEYTQRLEDWNNYNAFFEGDRQALLKSDKLWYHEFERSNKVQGGSLLRQIRQERTRYVNFCQSVVQKYISLTLQHKIDFSEIKELFDDDEFENIDGQGNSLPTYIVTNIAKDYFLYGRVIDEVNAKEDGGRAYLMHWAPQSMTDWQVNNDEQDYFVNCYEELLKRQSAHEEPVIQPYLQHAYLEGGKYTVTRYTTQGDCGDGSYEVDQEFNTDLDFIPFAYTDSASWVERFYPILLSLYNLQSAEDNILNFQAFQKIFASGRFQKGEGQVIMESGLSMLPEGSSITVVDPANPVALKERIERAKADLFRVAFFQNRIIPMDSKATESADNQVQQKEDLISTLSLAGEAIAKHTNDLLNKFFRFKGKDTGDAQAVFDFKNLVINDEMMNNFIAMFSNDVRRYPIWEKELMKYAAKRMNLDNIDDVLQAIDSGPTSGTQQRSLRDRLTSGGAQEG